VIEALDLIVRHAGTSAQFYPPEESVVVDGVVRPDWDGLLVEVDSRGPEADRIHSRRLAGQNTTPGPVARVDIGRRRRGELGGLTLQPAAAHSFFDRRRSLPWSEP
jgi:hypothetical protein